ncbi:MAG: DUF4124 domain-containing protein [Chromatiales bacterium]
MRLIVLATAGLFSAVAPADTELYKWTDEGGIVHFSDQPGPGAEKIRVRDVPTIAAPPLQDIAAPKDTAGFHYQAMAITSPPNNGTVRDNSGAVNVSVELVPPLRSDLGHSIRVSLDGQTQGGAATQFAFANVDRGTHSVKAAVLDKAGKTLMHSSSSFTLHRASRLLRNNQPAQGGASPGGAPTPPAGTGGANAPAATGGTNPSPTMGGTP